MFSPTTIASSTTIPSERIKAKSETIFNETSNTGISQKAPRKDIGMPIVVQKARRISRKSVRQINTRARPMYPFLFRRSILDLSKME